MHWLKHKKAKIETLPDINGTRRSNSMKTKFSLFIIRILIFPTFFSSISIFRQFWFLWFLFPVQNPNTLLFAPTQKLLFAPPTTWKRMISKKRWDWTKLTCGELVYLCDFSSIVSYWKLDWKCWNVRLNFLIEFCFWFRVLRGNERRKTWSCCWWMKEIREVLNYGNILHFQDFWAKVRKNEEFKERYIKQVIFGL